jgi:multidrug efflux pump subunit AcrA (membrane-fusion protein)
MQVEVDVPNPNYKLTAGMYADVTLRTKDAPNALTLPLQAIDRGENKTRVLVVNTQNRIEPREIQTGIESSDRIQILAGVNEGDRVIVGNLSGYHPGEVVEPKLSASADENFDPEQGAH